MPGTEKAVGNGRKDYQERRRSLISKLRQGKPLEQALAECEYRPETRSRLRHDAEIRAVVREAHANQFLDLVPLALKGMKESLNSPNERVKGDMSKFVLKEAGVLEALKRQEGREGEPATPEEVLRTMNRLESLLEGAKQAQERNEKVIEHDKDQ